PGASAPAPLAAETSSPSGVQSQGWADVPGSAPAAAALPLPSGGSSLARKDVAISQTKLDPSLPAGGSVSQTAEAGSLSAASAKEMPWTEVRRRMREMGVSLYW